MNDFAKERQRPQMREMQAMLPDVQRAEVGQLVRHNRPTTTTWNRCHCPSFVSHYLKTVKDKTYLAPEEIEAVRVENLLLGMAAVLQEQGSALLSHSIWRNYLQIIECAKGSRTVDAFIDSLTQSAPAAEDAREKV